MPPELEDDDIGNEILDMDDLDTVEAESSELDVAPKGEPAKSSAAGDETEATTLSIVRDVADGKTPAEAASSAENPEAGQPGDQPTKQDDVDYTDVPFHEHPRFQHLLRAKKVAERDATSFRKVDTFCRENNLSADEAAEALVVAASAKADPVTTLERLRPWIVDLMTRAGVLLPVDLQQGVQQGTYSPEAAQEISRSRAQVQSFRTQQELQSRRDQESHAARQVQSLRDTAVSWETDRKVKDPNFEAKLPAIMREVAFLHATEGRPTTAQAVNDQLGRAYAEVNKKFTAPALPRPAKTATRPVTGGHMNGNARPVRRSTLDIIKDHVEVA